MNDFIQATQLLTSKPILIQLSQVMEITQMDNGCKILYIGNTHTLIKESIEDLGFLRAKDNTPKYVSKTLPNNDLSEILK